MATDERTSVKMLVTSEVNDIPGLFAISDIPFDESAKKGDVIQRTGKYWKGNFCEVFSGLSETMSYDKQLSALVGRLLPHKDVLAQLSRDSAVTVTVHVETRDCHIPIEIDPTVVQFLAEIHAALIVNIYAWGEDDGVGPKYTFERVPEPPST